MLAQLTCDVTLYFNDDKKTYLRHTWGGIGYANAFKPEMRPEDPPIPTAYPVAADNAVTDKQGRFASIPSTEISHTVEGVSVTEAARTVTTTTTTATVVGRRYLTDSGGVGGAGGTISRWLAAACGTVVSGCSETVSNGTPVHVEGISSLPTVVIPPISLAPAARVSSGPVRRPVRGTEPSLGSFRENEGGERGGSSAGRCNPSPYRRNGLREDCLISPPHGGSPAMAASFVDLGASSKNRDDRGKQHHALHSDTSKSCGQGVHTKRGETRACAVLGGAEERDEARGDGEMDDSWEVRKSSEVAIHRGYFSIPTPFFSEPTCVFDGVSVVIFLSMRCGGG